MAPALPIDRSGDFGKVAVFWAALRQASARHCACICGTKIKAQGSVENMPPFLLGGRQREGLFCDAFTIKK
jgi:hypothetical protein